MIKNKARGCGGISGYQLRNDLLYRVWNLTLFFPILIASLPVFFLLYVILRLIQGTPVFYRGIRLGKDKKPFYIYKFRTLVCDADKHTKDCVLPVDSGLETPAGKFLRESRLDELPQLLNILRGEMNFIGPRPVRPEIARASGLMIRNYDIRFSVTPGLIGYTQLFMTHRTPKKIRARFNNYFCRRRVIFWKEPLILAMTVRGMISKMWGLLKKRLLRMAEGQADKEYEVFSPVLCHRKKVPVLENNRVMLASMVGQNFKFTFLLADINDEAFAFFSSASLSEGENRFLLQMRLSSSKKHVRAHCLGKIVRKDIISERHGVSGMKIGNSEYSHFYLVYYRPVSEFDFYKIDKYFLNNSILN